MNINDEGVKKLMGAIVMQAVRDYRSALYRYNTERKRDKKEDAKRTIRECEVFFRENIGAYSEIDGVKIINKLREDVRRSLKKRRIKMEVPKSDH